jgi:phospholipase/carboxylesterase
MTDDPHADAPILRAGPARAALAMVLLHGRGGAAGEMLSMGAALAPADVAFFAPQAAGRSWWPTSFLAPMAQLQPWLDSALAAADRAIAAARAEGWADERIMLLGFSQGACLALEHVARAGRRYAGVCGLSGGLVGTADADAAPSADLYGHPPKRFEYAGRLDGVPAYLGCHAMDPHIPRRRVDESARTLTALGASVTTAIHPGQGHAIVDRDVAAVRAMIAQGTRPADG